MFTTIVPHVIRENVSFPLLGLIWKLQSLREPGLFPRWVIHGDIILIVILVLSGRFSILGFCSPLLPKEPLVSLSPFHLLKSLFVMHYLFFKCAMSHLNQERKYSNGRNNSSKGISKNIRNQGGGWQNLVHLLISPICGPPKKVSARIQSTDMQEVNYFFLFLRNRQLIPIF